VEEFVKDLIEEVEESKRDMKSLRETHEREIEEMNGEWLKDYRAVTRELDALKLAQETRLLQQEITNEEEDSVYKNLLAGKRRVEELEMKIAEYEEQGYASSESSDDTVVASTSKRYDTASEHNDMSTDIELDLISETSSSRTCVSVGHDAGRQTKSLSRTQRKRCVSLRSPHEDCARTSLSLKPLIFDHARSVSALESSMSVATRTYNHSGRPMAVRNRTLSSFSLKTPPEKLLGEATKRAPWR
jgi:hypothetical protein